MALPTQTDLDSMDFAWRGQPYVDVSTKSSIFLTTMDYAWMAQPFVSNPTGTATPQVPLYITGLITPSLTEVGISSNVLTVTFDVDHMDLTWTG